MKTVEFLIDFASPNAYFSYRVLPSIADRLGAQINYTPCLLGGIFKATGNESPVTAHARVKGKLAYDQLEIQRFIKDHQLTAFQFNPHFPVNSLLLMRGAIAAQKTGQLTDYIEAGFVHMWEEPKKMDDPDIFVEALTQSGLDGQALLAQTQNPEIKQVLIENTNNAVERGVFGVPTFFVGDDMYFGKDRLATVENALMQA